MTHAPETAAPDHNAQAREQAVAQLNSIIEMTDALDIAKMARAFTDLLSLDQCKAMYAKYIDADPAEEYPDDFSDIITAQLFIEELILKENFEPTEWSFDEDSAREAIQEDALEICVRSGWVNLGEKMEAEEFYILLCTGGPAVRIRGELDANNEPSRAWLEFQDWGTNWETLVTTGTDNEALIAYAQQFFFGE